MNTAAHRWTTTACELASRAAGPWLEWAVDAHFAGTVAVRRVAAPSRHVIAAGVVCAGIAVVDLALPCAGPALELGGALAVAAVAAHAVRRVAATHVHAPRFDRLLARTLAATRGDGAAHECLVLASSSDPSVAHLARALGRVAARRATAHVGRRALRWIPGLGPLVTAADAVRDVLANARWVADVQREATALCTAPVVALHGTPRVRAPRVALAA